MISALRDVGAAGHVRLTDEQVEVEVFRRFGRGGGLLRVELRYRQSDGAQDEQAKVGAGAMTAQKADE